MKFPKKYTEDEGLICADAIFEETPNITAILCANDRLALGALEAVNSRGLEVPNRYFNHWL